MLADADLKREVVAVAEEVYECRQQCVGEVLALARLGAWDEVGEAREGSAHAAPIRPLLWTAAGGQGGGA